MKTRLLAIALVAVLLVPAVSHILPHATAQPQVPGVPGVTFVDQQNLVQTLFARFSNAGDQQDAMGRQPNCVPPGQAAVPTVTPPAAIPGGPPSGGDIGGTRFLGFTAAPEETGRPRSGCTFQATIPGVQQGDRVDFTFRTATTTLVLRDFQIHGNRSLSYTHRGSLPTGSTLTASLLTGDETIASGTNTTPATDPREATHARLDLQLVGNAALTGIATIKANRTLTLRLEVSVPAQGGVPGQATSWQVNDAGSFLTIRAQDLIRAATWVEDQTSTVRHVFKPIDNFTAKGNERIVGKFALQSALSIEDAQRGAPPVFTLVRNGQPQQIGSAGASFLVGQFNSSASVPSQGVAVWSFPEGTFNYLNFPAGAYELKVEKSHHLGAPIREGISHPVLVTSPSVALRPFDDGRVAETTSHGVQPGGTTTYLLSLNNTGTVNDTFSLNLTTPNLAAGWSIQLGGPEVVSRRIFVPAGQERLVTVTVNAPAGATVGAQAIAIVNATSSVDPNARSTDIILTTAIDNLLRRELAIIIPATARNLEVEPGVDRDVPVYVWNRGTRVANTSIEIQHTAVEGWNVHFAQGALLTKRLVLSNVPPGGIAEATLRVRGPASETQPRHDLTLNATLTDTPGITADRPVTLLLRSVSGVNVQILTSIGATGHVVEVSGDFYGRAFSEDAQGKPVRQDGLGQDTREPACRDFTRGRDPCPEDGIDGVWFRVWVTNTGQVRDTFRLSGDTYRVARLPNVCPGPGSTSGVFETRAMDNVFRFYWRSPSGAPTSVTEIPDLEPGKTAEVYVWVPADQWDDPCLDENRNEDFFNFVVQAQGARTGALGRANAEVIARDEGGVEAVLVEAVPRDRDYSPAKPLVDIANASKRTVTGFAQIGENTTYKVRVTTGASWSNYTDQVNGRRFTPNVTFAVENFDRESGWNVSFRPVLEGLEQDFERNPWTRIYNITNFHNGRYEGWFDQEFEVRISAPSVQNATALAGDVFQSTLRASINGTNVASSINLRTVVSELAKVEMRAESREVLAHANEPAAFQIYIANNGSAPTTATLRAKMVDGTPTGWRVEPSSQSFQIPAFRNRTVAIFVTPPANAGQGQSAQVNLTIEYVQNPVANINKSDELRLTTNVVPPGNLQLTALGSTDSTIKPGGVANFSLQMRNKQTGGQGLPYRLTTSQISGWNIQPVSESGTLGGSETRNFVVVMQAPADATNGSRFSTIVRIEEPGVSADFSTVVLNVNIEGGQALPSLSVPNPTKRVDRDGVQNFEVNVRNLGSAAGRIPLEVRVSDPAWSASVQNLRGDNISAVTVGPNELVPVNVSVRAPFTVNEGKSIDVDLIAYTPDGNTQTRVTLRADIHDYGVDVSLEPATRDALPGQPVEFLVKLRNTGNDNDTINVSANLVELPEWNVQMSVEEVRLEPGQEQEVRASVRSPLQPLTTPRTYNFQFYAGTRGGQAVNITKNDTVTATVVVPNYRALDVDRDDQVELAVDLDKRAQNGFEVFREISSEGLQTNVVASGLFRNKTAFFLDVPRDRPYDGVADVWFDPEAVFAYEITQTPDVNDDGTPDYFVDTDRDGKIDHMFDTVTQRYYVVSEIKVFGDERIQYLADVNGDGKPDRFYDPEGPVGKKVTRTQAATDQGPDVLGIDTDGDDKVDRYYNTRTNTASQAVVGNFGTFARDNWWFFAAFGALVLVTVLLLVARRRRT